MAIPEIEDEDELQEILASSGLVAIDFSAGWCAPCKVLFPKLEALAADDKYSAITFVNIDVDELEDFADEVEVSNLPTVGLFRGGEELGRAEGSDIDAVVALLDAALGAAAKPAAAAVGARRPRL